MPGPGRRSKRLKQSTSLDSIGAFASNSPVDGDILIYDSGDGVYANGRALTGNYSISGQLTAADLLITNDITITDALTVGGNAGVTGDLSVIGSTALNGLATIGGTLGVTGAVTLSDALSVAGTLTGVGFSFEGSGQIDTDLTVTGTLTVGTLTLADLSLSGDLSVTGTMEVTSTSVFGDDVQINANLSASAIAATSLNTSGGISIGGTISFGVGGELTHSTSLLPVTFHNTVTSGEHLFTSIQTDGATTHTMLTLDPDGAATLRHNNVEMARTGADLFELWDGSQWNQSAFAGGAFHDGFSDFASDEHFTEASIYNIAIQNIGSNTHAQIDSHIGDASLHFAQGGLDDNTDVTLSTPVTGALLVKGATDWLNTAFVLVDDGARKISFIGVGFDKDVHIAITSDVFEIKTNDFNDLGLTIATGAATSLFFAGVSRLATTSVGADVFGALLDVDNSGSTGLVAVRVRNSEGGLELRADNDGFSLNQTDSDGVFEANWLTGINNGAVALDYAGVRALDTTVDGATSWGAGADKALHRIKTSDSSRAMWLGFNSTSTLELRNFAVSGNTIIQSRDTGSTDRIGLLHDPDAGVQLYHTGSASFQTIGVSRFGIGAVLAANGAPALTRTMAGLELTATGQNTSNKYCPAIKFMSSDAQFTT